MSLKRFAAKRDRAEAPIVAYLRATGWKVRHLSEKGFADLAAYKPSYGLLLLEVKTGKGRLTEAQVQHRADGWPVHLVRTVEDVARLAQSKGVA